MSITLLPTDTIPIETMVRDVMMYLPGAPSFEVEYRMKQAVRDFCRKSRVWQQRDTALLTTIAGQARYENDDLPDGVDVAAIISCWDSNGVEITVALPGEQEDAEPGETSTTFLIDLVPETNVLRLTPAPEVADLVLSGTVAFAPNEAATTIPSILYWRWRSEVSAGCKASMMKQPNKPWSNPMWQVYDDEFKAGIDRASNASGPVRKTNRLRTKYQAV